MALIAEERLTVDQALQALWIRAGEEEEEDKRRSDTGQNQLNTKNQLCFNLVEGAHSLSSKF